MNDVVTFDPLMCSIQNIFHNSNLTAVHLLPTCMNLHTENFDIILHNVQEHLYEK